MVEAGLAEVDFYQRLALMDIIPVILSGGSGSRLWPISRTKYPKQLIPLLGDNSLLQQTTERSMAIGLRKPPVIICNQEHRFEVAEQLRKLQVQDARLVLEPVGRNTAPAIAVAALVALDLDADPVLLVMPSDHLIRDTQAFGAAVQQGLMYAKAGKLVTFGITPDHPATGYGYIKAAAAGVAPIVAFVEKPDLDNAQRYLDSGEYYWNSGIFLFKARSFLDELGRYAADILNQCKTAYGNSTSDLDFLRLPMPDFAKCRSDSIDYAVMQKTEAAMVVPMRAGWSDLGSWESLWENGEQDAQGNVMQGDVLLEDVRNAYIRAESRLVAVVGVSDHVIVETADAVLVAHKSRTEEIKQIVSRLSEQARDEVNWHTRVHRPWGSYETIDEAERFKVKRIGVKPGASLSLQMHHHRAEHWIVVKGTARVTCDEKVFLLSENESTYIPLGTRHRLENPGTIMLELIEVQSGSYLGEDDIVRFEDRYGR